MFRIPMYPTMRRSMFASGIRSEAQEPTSAFIANNVVTTLNARSALMIGLEASDLQQGDEVLVPAYHCPVMIYPIVHMGCRPVYYKIGADCRIDLADIAAKISPRTRIVIAAHYFGFPTPLDQIARLCRNHGVWLFEDCAHAFLGQAGGPLPGTSGDFSFASIYKFFPVYEGGCLRCNAPALQVAKATDSSRAPLALELKWLFNSLEVRTDVHRRSLVLRGLLGAKESILRLLTKRHRSPSPMMDGAPITSDLEDQSDSPYRPEAIAPTYQHWRAPIFARAILHASNLRRIAQRRRENYARMLAAVSALPTVRPLFPYLDEATVPYNFPLLCDRADGLARGLRERGIGVARFGEYYWNEADRHICEVSDRLSRNCIQLPIHQSLDRDDMDVLVASLTEVCYELETG